MLATDLVMGRAYARRAKPQDAECPLRKTIFVGPARSGKVKIRHADGDLDGLEEWVPTRTLMCPWGARQAFLHDESRWNALLEAAARDFDPVVEQAISTVFEATGDKPASTGCGQSTPIGLVACGVAPAWTVRRISIRLLTPTVAGSCTFPMKQPLSSRRLSPPRSLSRVSITSGSRKTDCAPKATSLGTDSATVCCEAGGQLTPRSANGRKRAN
jgi:hypothetical protein